MNFVKIFITVNFDLKITECKNQNAVFYLNIEVNNSVYFKIFYYKLFSIHSDLYAKCISIRFTDKFL